MRQSQLAVLLPQVLERMIASVEAENVALRERRPYPIAELSARKSMAHFEIERISRLVPTAPPFLLDRLAYARKLLEDNSALLKRNLDALSGLIEILHSYQMIDESDGTYSVQSFSGLIEK